MMNLQKPKSIKNTGLFISIFAGLVVFSNGMGAFIFTLLGFNDYDSKEIPNVISLDYFFNNISSFLLILVLFGVLFFVSGIYLMKYKIWAKNLILGLSIVLISLLSLLLFSGIYTVFNDNEYVFALILIVIIWMMFSIPLFLLIRFLKRKDISKHLE